MWEKPVCDQRYPLEKSTGIQCRLAILVPVSEPKFAQPARRNLLAPVLVAFVIMGIAIALVVRYTPHAVADLTILRTAVYPTHVVYKSDTLVVGRDQTQDN